MATSKPTIYHITESILGAAWQRRGVLACLLWPLSLLFRAVSALRRSLYAAGRLRSTRLPVPVIVVGNIFVGGTGKTPLTIWLVHMLRQAGYVPGVISRGYAAHATGVQMVRHVTQTSLASEVGDEPLLIATHGHSPVVVGRDRVAAAEALLQAHPEINLIVSDDGLQHYRLQRDIEIMLFDSRGIGNGWVLPAGPLREPASRRRDFTVVNAASIQSSMPASSIRMKLVGELAVQLTDPAQCRLLSALRDQSLRIAAAAGIGNPQRFFSMLSAAGLVFEALALPDHCNFSDNPFAAMTADLILITEKDAVKCRQIESIKHDPRIWVVPVTAQIDSALSHQIHHILEKLRVRSTA